MKNKIFNNWALKLFALIVAFVVWFVVVQVSDPQITETFDVPIDFENEKVLKDEGKVATNYEETVVTIKVKSKRSIISTLTEKDFSATADFAKMYNDTQVPIVVESHNSSVTSADIDQESLSVGVTIEKLATVDKVIEYETTGKPASGYVVGDVTIEPSSVTVTCPESLLTYVNQAKVKLDVSGLYQETELSAEIGLYDGNGDSIPIGDETHINWDANSVAKCKVSFRQVQTVTIDVKVSDTDSVAQGYRYVGTTVNPSKITISGTREKLSEVTSITIDDISAKGLNAKVDRDVDIRSYLPEGVEVYEGETTVRVSLNVEELAIKTISVPASSISLDNLSSKYKASITGDVTIKVKGISSKVNALTADDIAASLDLDGLRTGTHKVTLKVKFASEDFSLIDRVDVPVTITDK